MSNVFTFVLMHTNWEICLGGVYINSHKFEGLILGGKQLLTNIIGSEGN